MRKRINRAAVCSSDNYSVSKRVHQMYLRERHAHFNEMVVNGEIAFDQPIFKDGNFDYTLRRYKEDAYRHVMDWLDRYK